MATFTVPPNSARGRQDVISKKESSCPFRPDAAIAEPMLDALSNAHFPCVFARPAYEHGHLRFERVDLSGSDHVARAYEMVVDYLDTVRATAVSSPRQAAMQVLLLDVVIAEPFTAESVRDTAWNLLFRLHEHDRRRGHSWPDGVSANMDHPTWSYCLAETPIFVNMTSSTLRQRRSRNLGRPLVLVIQPTDGLHYIAPLTPAGDRIREKIRSRVDTYDGMRRSAALANSGQEGNSDWRQFWLGDSDFESSWRPPQIPSCLRTADRSA